MTKFTADDLVRIRVALGKTQVEMSNDMWTPLKTYQKWEQGLVRIPGAAARLALYLEMSAKKVDKAA